MTIEELEKELGELYYQSASSDGSKLVLVDEMIAIAKLFAKSQVERIAVMTPDNMDNAYFGIYKEVALAIEKQKEQIIKELEEA